MSANEDQNAESTAVQANSTSENGTAAAVDGTQQAQPEARQGGWAIAKSLLIRMFFIYMISSFFRRSPAPAENGPDGKPLPAAVTGANLFTKDVKFDLFVYLKESESFSDYNSGLFWHEEDLIYGDWYGGINGDGSYEKSSKFKTPDTVLNNGTLFLHTFVVKSGYSPDPKDENYDTTNRIHRFRQMNKYKKRVYHITVNLLTGASDVHPDLIKKDNGSSYEVISCWHPNITINLVEDYTPWQRGAVPQPLDEYIQFTDNGRHYLPILYYNDYWNLNTDYMPINETTPELTLTITFSPISLFKWQMYAAQGMRNKWYSQVFGDDFMAETDDDQDSLKTTLVETNPYLLGLTIVVSLIHSVFEFMAFKNDIQFWKNKKSLEGLSVRSVFFNVFQSLIVLLYVLDNETNFVVRISVFVGLAIEIWKITKVVDIKLDRENRFFGLPRPTWSEKATYVESDTKKYDQMAFKYLSWCLFPLLAAYAVYSLLYLEHRSWYSWVLGMLYGFLLTFGFIMMTPQLFINYKMKSIAHLPWRMMTYKALNTFIDDLFAFVIKMPMLYRLGCFRDDIVFVIFLYQKWIYPVDHTRVNEFGVSGADLTDAAEKKADGSNGTAVTDGAATPDQPDGKKTEQEKKDD